MARAQNKCVVCAVRHLREDLIFSDTNAPLCVECYLIYKDEIREEDADTG